MSFQSGEYTRRVIVETISFVREPVISEIDVRRTVKLLIDWHGEAAAILTATDKAEKPWRQGDAEGASTWERVARAIAAVSGTQTEGPIH